MDSQSLHKSHRKSTAILTNKHRHLVSTAKQLLVHCQPGAAVLDLACLVPGYCSNMDHSMLEAAPPPCQH